MKNVFFFILSLVIGQSLYAQNDIRRDFWTNDSTFHDLNVDTTIVVGNSTIYTLENGSLNFYKDFPYDANIMSGFVSPTDYEEYYFIEDFEIVTEDQWYALMANAYIGGNTFLYKTMDGGSTWTLDSSYFAAQDSVIGNSYGNVGQVNNMEVLGTDTLVVFVGYYISGAIYSLDRGQTWEPWFDQLTSHFQGILTCDGQYYVYQFAGDPFYPSYFAVDVFETENVPFCALGSSPQYCYEFTDYAMYGSVNELVQVMQAHADSICPSLPTNIIHITNTQEEFSIYPNPARDYIQIDFSGKVEDATIYIYNTLGVLVSEHKNMNLINIRNLPNGVYTILLVDNENRTYQQQLIIQKD